MFKGWIGKAAVAVACLWLSACGTFSNSGGFTDRVMDSFLFAADSKQHRLLRDYVLLASLTRLAERSGLSAAEKAGLAADIGSSIELTATAFECVYANARCAFFDEKLAELDIMILRMMFRVLLPVEDREISLSLIQAFRGKTPIDDFLSVPQQLLKTTNVTAKAFSNTTEIISSILSFSFDQYQRGHRIGALWRDAIELDIQVVVDSLCRPSSDWSAAGIDLVSTPGRADFCARVRAGYRNGYSDLSAWKQLLEMLPPVLRARIVPDSRHFTQVSVLIISACKNLGLTAAKTEECNQTKTGRLLFAQDAKKQSGASQQNSAEGVARRLAGERAAPVVIPAASEAEAVVP